MSTSNISGSGSVPRANGSVAAKKIAANIFGQTRPNESFRDGISFITNIYELNILGKWLAQITMTAKELGAETRTWHSATLPAKPLAMETASAWELALASVSATAE